MFYPVKVYKKHPNAGGKVKRVISSKALAKRSDSMGTFSPSIESTGEPTKKEFCKTCGKRFPRQWKISKYCSTGCAAAMKKIRDRKNGKQRRKTLREKKALAGEGGKK